MNTLSRNIIESKMARLNDELETTVSLSGAVYESVNLGLGDTTLKREVLSDGSRGEIQISTQENDDFMGSSITYRNYLLVRDGLVPDARYGERTVGILKKASVLAKVAFGRVNHWDRESDFYGTTVEYDED